MSSQKTKVFSLIFGIPLIIVIGLLLLIFGQAIVSHLINLTEDLPKWSIALLGLIVLVWVLSYKKINSTNPDNMKEE